MVVGDSDREADGERDVGDEAELLPLRQRFGLWCAMFPGCGVLLIGLLILCAAPVFRGRAVRSLTR